MAEYNPDDLISRTFLLPKNEQGERLRATIKRKVIESSKLLDDQHDIAIDKINFHLDVGQGRAEAIMSYVQILDHLDQQEQQEDLYKYRAITGHQGPLSPQDENYKGSKYNVMVESETGDIIADLEFDWTRIYGGVLEEIPKDAPEPLGKSVTTTTFLDDNLLHDLITGRSVTAVLHFFNLTPVDWYSKRQATVENATFG